MQLFLAFQAVFFASTIWCGSLLAKINADDIEIGCSVWCLVITPSVDCWFCQLPVPITKSYNTIQRTLSRVAHNMICILLAWKCWFPIVHSLWSAWLTAILLCSVVDPLTKKWIINLKNGDFYRMIQSEYSKQMPMMSQPPPLSHTHTHTHNWSNVVRKWCRLYKSRYNF